MSSDPMSRDTERATHDPDPGAAVCMYGAVRDGVVPSRVARRSHWRLASCLVLVGALLAVGGCRSLRRANSDFDSGTDFSGLHGYRIQAGRSGEPAAEVLENSLFDQRMKRSLDLALQERGFRPAGEADADFVAVYRVVLDDVSDVYDVYGGPWWNDGFWVRRYERGMLVVDITANRTGDLLWRGWCPFLLYVPSMSAKRIAELVDEALADFPPK